MSAATWLETLGWLSLASLAVFAGVALLNRFVPRREAGLRHALLALVLIRLVLPPATASPVSVWSLVGDWPAAVAVAPSLEATPASLHGFSTTPSPLAPPTETPWAALIAALWLAGAMATAIWLTARRRRYRRMAKQGRPVQDGPARVALDRWRRLFNLRRRVQVVVSPVPTVPFTLGVWRPVIVLPEALTEAGDDAAIEAVVAHELAHVQRLDDLWLTLQRLTQSLFFFHPIVWITTRAMGIEREHACDRLVLASGVLSPKSYGRSLLKVIGLQQTSATVAAAAGSHRRLTMRIHHIAKLAGASRPSIAHCSVAPILLLACALLPAATTGGQPPASSVPGAEAGEVIVTGKDPFSSDLSLDDLMPGAKITAGFGMRRHPFEGGMAHHDGVDLSTGKESPVYVPRGGTIEVAQENYGSGGKFGTVVIVDHGGGLKTFYAHLASLSVRAGEGISDGEQIGLAGNTGVSSGPHLHFEIWKDGEKVDPANIAEVLGDC